MKNIKKSRVRTRPIRGISTNLAGTGELNNSTSDDMLQEIYLTTLLAEYGALRAELLQIQSTMHQLSTYALGSVAGLVTVIVSAGTFGMPNLLAPILLVLPLPFIAMLISFVGHLNEAVNITKYILSHTEPMVNRILQPSADIVSSNSVILWEHFAPRRKSRWLTDGLWAGGQAMLMVMPILGAFIGYYVVIEEFKLTIQRWWNILLIFDVIIFVVAILLSTIPIVRRFLIKSS